MPIHEFVCPSCGAITEKIFFTFSQADGVDEIPCSSCGVAAKRTDFVSPPLEAHFYGNPDGYHKPSPTKRQSYKKAKLGAVGNDWTG